MRRWRAQPSGMTIQTINAVMREARRLAGDEAAVLLLLIAAGRLAERLRIPLTELEVLLGSAYRASATSAPRMTLQGDGAAPSAGARA